MMNESARTTFVQLPDAVDRFLRRYARQRNRLLFLREMAIIVIVLVGWLTLCALADRVLHLGRLPRSLMLAVTVVVFGVWIVTLLRQTLLATFDVYQAALELETLKPDLDQRLSTICSRMPDRQSGVSQDMLDWVARQVQQSIEQDRPMRLMSVGRVRTHLIGATIVCISALALMFSPAFGFPRLLFRLAAPWSGAAPVTTTRLTLGIGREREIFLKEGQAVILNVGVAHAGEEGVIVQKSSDQKTWEARPIVQTGVASFQGIIGPVTADQWFYISSGDAQTPTVHVRVLRPPMATEFRVQYEYPAYIHREPLTITNTDGLIEAPVGSKATVRVVASETLRSATITTPDGVLELSHTIEGSVMQLTIPVSRDRPYTLTLVSDKELVGHGPTGSQIRAIPDRPPYVRLIAPVEDLRLSPRDITPLHYQVIDDYGVAELAVRAQVNSTPPVDIPIRPSRDPRRVEGTQDLDLASLVLRIGDVVSVNLVARDTAGQTATSEYRYIFISPNSVDSADHQRLWELERSDKWAKDLAAQIDAAIAAMNQSKAVRADPVKAAQVAADYQQRVASMGEDAGGLKGSLQRAITRSTETQRNDLLALMIDRAQVRMIDAHDLADEIGQGDARENNARQRLQIALEQTRQMRNQLQKLVSAEQAAAALADRRNVQAATQATADGRMTSRGDQMLDRLRQDVAGQMRQLALNPDDPTIEQQLQRRVAEGKAVIQATRPPDLVDAARQWSSQLLEPKMHSPMFDRRLSAGADVEAIRPDGSAIRARDLRRAAKAAQTIWQMSQASDPQQRTLAKAASEQFADALAELEKHNLARTASLQQKSQSPGAEAARRKLAQWAGDIDLLAQSPDAPLDEQTRQDLAMEANAEMTGRRFDRAAELQRRMQMEPWQTLDANQAMQRAKAAQTLADSQDALRQQTQSGDNQPDATMAQTQREMALSIAHEMEADERGFLPQDTRAEGLAAIHAAQERLAQMPQQLQEVTSTADVQLQAHELTQRLAKEVERAPVRRKDSAQFAADRADIALADARKQTEKALVPLDPQTARALREGLLDFEPEAGGAVQAIEKNLGPALESVKQNAGDNKAGELVRSIRKTRDAIALVQQELRKAQDAMLDKDPLYAAKVYADAAAEALSRIPPDTQGAIANQRRTSESLAKQSAVSMRDAAAARIASLPQLQDVYEPHARAGPFPAGPADLTQTREWGQLRPRENNDRSAVTHEEDPGGYQQMLQAYFRALGKTQTTEGGK